jgi:hypothetical protein
MTGLHFLVAECPVCVGAWVNNGEEEGGVEEKKKGRKEGRRK